MTSTTAPITSFIARKGGVGKSTCCTVIARIFAASGLRVAVVDCDPQASTTNALLLPEDRADSLVEEFGEALCSGEPVAPLLCETSQENLYIVPAGEPLTQYASLLSADNLGVVKMQRALDSLAEAAVDLVLIDTRGDYDAFTFGALGASDWAVIVTECQQASAQEVPKALGVIRETRSINPELGLLGIIANSLDLRTNHDARVLETLKQAFPRDLIEPPTPAATALKDALKPAQPIDPRNDGYRALIKVAEEMLRRQRDRTGKNPEGQAVTDFQEVSDFHSQPQRRSA